jgi:hypothetical protein
MDTFWVATVFAFKVYGISTFIVFVVLAIVNILNRFLQEKES